MIDALGAIKMAEKIKSDIEIGFDRDSTYNSMQAGKLEIQRIDPDFLDGMAALLKFGSDKYPNTPWWQGLSYTQVIASLERHVQELKRGNDFDPEHGLHHAYAIAVNAMFLAYYQQRPEQFGGYDDRFFKESRGHARIDQYAAKLQPETRPPEPVGEPVHECEPSESELEGEERSSVCSSGSGKNRKRPKRYHRVREDDNPGAAGREEDDCPAEEQS